MQTHTKPGDLSGIGEILQEYRRRRLRDNLTGPSFSFLVHLTILSLLLWLVHDSPRVVTHEDVFEFDIADATWAPDPPDPPDPEDPPEPKPGDVTNFVPPGPAVSPPEPTGGTTWPETPPEPDVDPDPDPQLAIRDWDPQQSRLRLPMPYRTRTDGRERQRAVADGGGREDIQTATVPRALKWLAQVQEANGSWGPNSPAHTGMALLVFLARGETPMSDDYGRTVYQGLLWLCQQVENSREGYLGQRAYGHGIAVYALAEAYGMTGLPIIKHALDRAGGITVAGQQRNGGFDYDYAQGQRWDLSVSGWQFQALKAAAVAGSGDRALADAGRQAALFCRRTAYANGKFGYSSAGSGGNMTGVGALTLQLFERERSRELNAALETIAKERLPLLQKVQENPRLWDEVAGANLYGWYYDTQALFHARRRPDGSRDARAEQVWRRWRDCCERVLATHQQPEGYWEVAEGHGLGPDLQGRIMATCWSTLQLQVYYKILKTFDTEALRKHTENQPDLNEVMTDSRLVISIE